MAFPFHDTGLVASIRSDAAASFIEDGVSGPTSSYRAAGPGGGRLRDAVWEIRLAARVALVAVLPHSDADNGAAAPVRFEAKPSQNRGILGAELFVGPVHSRPVFLPVGMEGVHAVLENSLGQQLACLGCGRGFVWRCIVASDWHKCRCSV